MDGMQISGPQLTENGTFMPTEEVLDGKQDEVLTTLVINKTLAKQEEMAAQLRTSAMNDLGKGQKLNISA